MALLATFKLKPNLQTKLQKNWISALWTLLGACRVLGCTLNLAQGTKSAAIHLDVWCEELFVNVAVQNVSSTGINAF